MTFYAYVNARPTTVDASGIFYVGKGSFRRMHSVSKSSGNRHHGNIVAKHGKENILIGGFECSSEDIAFELEKGLIKCLRRMCVSLTNMTDGGEGSSGYSPTKETKEKLRVASSNLWATEEYRKTVFDSKIGKMSVSSPIKAAACRVNATKGQAVLRDNFAIKEQARLKNSIKSKIMWSDPIKAIEIALRNSNSWTPDKRALHIAKRIGTKILNNGTTEKRVHPEEIDKLVSEGWILGRKPSKRAKNS